MIVLTHPQRDHVGGAAKVLDRVRRRRRSRPGDPQREHRRAGGARGCAAPSRPRRRRPGGRGVSASASFDSVSSGRMGPGPPGDDPNNHAIVLLASYGQVDALLTADAESDVTGHLHLPPVEILKVAHHGSDDPGLARLLEQIHPRIAVISVGAAQRLRASDAVDDRDARSGARARRLSHRSRRPRRRRVGRQGHDGARRSADYAWRRCRPSRCCPSISSWAATGRSTCARSAAFAPASTPRLSSSSQRSRRAEPTLSRPATRSASSAALGGGRLVVVHGVEALAESGHRSGRGYLADPVEGAVLALVADEALRGTTLAELCKKNGQVLRYDVPKATQSAHLGARRVQAPRRLCRRRRRAGARRARRRRHDRARDRAREARRVGGRRSGRSA